MKIVFKFRELFNVIGINDHSVGRSSFLSKMNQSTLMAQLESKVYSGDEEMKLLKSPVDRRSYLDYFQKNQNQY